LRPLPQGDLPGVLPPGHPVPGRHHSLAAPSALTHTPTGKVSHHVRSASIEKALSRNPEEDQRGHQDRTGLPGGPGEDVTVRTAEVGEEGRRDKILSRKEDEGWPHRGERTQGSPKQGRAAGRRTERTRKRGSPHG